MIYLYQSSVFSGRGVYYEDPSKVIGNKTNDIYLAWTQPGDVQVEYRTRHRLAFTGQDIQAFATWSSWNQLYTTKTNYSIVKSGSEQFSYYPTALPITSSDVTGTYDLVQVQVRVRTYGSTPGAWETSNPMDVSFYPVYELISVELDLDTLDAVMKVAPYGLDGNNDPIISRPISNMTLGSIFDSGSEFIVQPWLKANPITFSYDTDGYVYMVIPAGIAYRLPQTGSVRIRMTTYDGVVDGEVSAYTLSIPSASTHIKEPDFTLTETPTGLQVDVVHEAAAGTYAAYDSVSVAYSWTDSRGVLTAGSIQLVKDVDWTGEIPAPPVGAVVDFTVTATGTYNSYQVQNFVSDSYTMGDSKWFMLSHGSELVWLGYELSISRNVDNNVTVTKLASGRNIARYGAGGETKLTLSGTILDTVRRGNISSIWLPDAQKLDESHDWYLRSPEGERFKVTVESWSLGASRNGIQQLSIDMQEVE